MKLKILFIIPFIIVVFVSCAVSKYDYYYAILDSPDTNTKKKNRTYIKNNIESYIWFLNSKSPVVEESDLLKKNDSISLRANMNIFEDRIFLGIYSDSSVWVDCQKTEILLNNMVYNPKLENRNCIDTIFLAAKKYYLLKEVEIPMSDLVKIYNEYDKVLYENINYSVRISEKNNNEYETRIRNKSMSALLFSPENSPLKIQVNVVYYTDNRAKIPRLVSFNIYQSELMKYAGKRKGEGEEIGKEREDVVFYAMNEMSRTWGWPEIRKGLGWTTTILCLPVTLIIDLVPVVFQGKETGTVPFPLFE